MQHVIPTRTRGRLRYWLLGALALFCASVALGEWLAWPFLRGPLQDKLSRVLQRPVQIGEPFGVRFIGSLRLHAQTLVIGPPGPDRAKDGPGADVDLMRAEGTRLHVPYATLWGLARGSDRAPYIDQLEVDSLQAQWLRDAQGRSNWRLGTPSAEAKPAQVLPEFGSLVVRNGDVQIDDTPLQLKLGVSLRMQEGARAASAPTAASAPAGLQARARGSHRGLQVNGDLSSSGLLPMLRAGTDAALPVPVKLDLRVGRARLKLDGSAVDALHLVGLDADFDLSGPSLAAIGDAVGLTLPATSNFEMQGRLKREGPVWAAAVKSLHVGSSRLRGDFRYDTAPAVPKLSGQLAGQRLALRDLGPAIGVGVGGGGEVDAPAPAARRGRVLPQHEFDVPSLRRMNADVVLQLDQLDLGTTQLEPFAPLQGRLRLQDAVLSVQDLLARTSDGEVRGALTMDARTPLPRWHADLRWSGINLERFVKARNQRTAEARAQAKAKAQGEPVAASAASANARGYVSGVLAGGAKVDGVGRSTAAMLASLSGNVRLWVREGRISHLLVELAGIDLAESLGVLVTGDQSLSMRCAVSHLTLQNGRAVPDIALIDTDDTTLTVGGQLSLADESLGLVVTARPHDISPLSLRGPVRIEGTFSDPTLSLDKRSIGLRLGAAAALAVLAPPAALLALVDLGDDDKHLCMQSIQKAQTGIAPRAR